jgi:hypothetical protein
MEGNRGYRPGNASERRIAAGGGTLPLFRLPSGYIRDMLGRFLPRLQAALLAAVIVGGGGGMPVMDVALYHGATATHPFQSHFENSGIPHSHGDVCGLSSSLPSCPQVPSLDLGIVVGPLLFRQATFPAPNARSVPSGILPHPRAPPSPLA